MLQRIGVKLRQRSPVQCAVAVQEPDGRRVHQDRGGDVLAPPERLEERVARRLRMVDVRNEPRLAAAQQLTFEQRIGQAQRSVAQRLAGGVVAGVARVQALDDERAVVDPAEHDTIEVGRGAGRLGAAVDDLAGRSQMRQRIDRLTNAFVGCEPQGVVAGHHSSP